MNDEINPKIMKKVNSIKDENIKKFLKDIIFEEFNNLDEGRWIFRETYDRIIKHYLERKHDN